jgi:hypothetical protein
MNERRKKLEELADQFFTACNGYGEREIIDAMKDRLDREHRTVIQSAMGVLKNVIEHYAEFHRSDLRNQDSLEWAKQVKNLKPDNFRYI